LRLALPPANHIARNWKEVIRGYQRGGRYGGSLVNNGGLY
jgi:hypothetical protein